MAVSSEKSSNKLIVHNPLSSKQMTDTVIDKLLYTLEDLVLHPERDGFGLALVETKTELHESKYGTNNHLIIINALLDVHHYTLYSDSRHCPLEAKKMHLMQL